MKPNPCAASRLVASFALLATTQIMAVDLYWDANGDTADTGGTGNWNLADLLWRSTSDTGTLDL